ncbi:MAG TPA: type II/IV secretion system ATPase subunit [Methanomicrobiales archaeon]|nr:type II/IV secretion system ATPase subunit [Methanomicrobiales archaeon]
MQLPEVLKRLRLKEAYRLFGKKIGAMRESEKVYDPDRNGILVTPDLPPGFDVVDVYWIERGLSLVCIALNQKNHQNEYILFEPKLSPFEYELLERLYEDLRDVLLLNEDEISGNRKQILLSLMEELIGEYGVKIDLPALFRLQYYLVRNFLGWSRIDALMKDPQIEDISCDGVAIPIFLYHRRYHNIKTNIIFDEDHLNSLAITLAQRSGKHISIGTPILDATLPDGSRLQLTFSKVVTSRGTSFSIRKFREEPFTPIELLEHGTFPVDAMVYFWLAIENNKSLLFIGGTASGKTTSLNAVSHFIPPLAKVVSIEDTREITLNRDNWIASVTRDAVIDGTSGAISMFDLLRAAMRQRPEYIIVGEVRGPEAQTLFQAMNTGHTTFSTLHAADVDAAVHRLENEPLNVPRNMLQALDVISIQALIYRGSERVRRCQEIVEIMGLDQATQNIQVNAVFSYDPVTDAFTYSGKSQVYNEIMASRGWTTADLEREILQRGKILIAMKEQGVKDYVSVSRIFQDYAIKPGEVMESLGDLRRLIA